MTSSEARASKTLRIIDASLNRIGESLRLLEDLARLLLNDAALTRQLKEIRHELTPSDRRIKQQLLQARDSEGDVGVNIEVRQQAKERGLTATIVANARRVQESLRVIEELAKVPGTKLNPEQFKRARFSLYAVERNLISRLLRKDKAKCISGLYAIIDTQFLKGRSHAEVAARVVEGGARIIQLRDKALHKREMLILAKQLKSLCVQHDALFIINDYLDVALATDADGLHLGQEDLPVKVARKLLPIDKIIGCSVATVEQAITAESEGADYIAIGAIYHTLSKEGVEVVGLETVRALKKEVSLPLVAIGGITQDNAAEVLSAGADSVAVISAILEAESPEAATRQMIAQLERQN